MQSITLQSDFSVAGQQLPDGTSGVSGIGDSAVATRAINHAAGSSSMAKRGCMIDGIAVSSAMLQALRSMQPSALAALSDSGVSKTATASAIPPQMPSSGEAARGHFGGNSPLGQDLDAQINSSPRRSKRQRVPRNAVPLSDRSDPAEKRACNVDLVDEEHGSITASNRDDARSQSDEDDDQLAQLMNLQHMVDQLTSLATENSARICGFNRNIESLFRTKDVLISQVDTLSLQLQQQEVQIEELQNNIYQMTLQNSANSDMSQHSSSSSSCFSL